jgi:FHS family L-fucose permease-like MFS transporter
MIDVMDKHFQDELGLTKSQSAWVQFAHYLGYFLMSIPAGWLAVKLGYKGGIIAGLLIVAAGGMWFIPATYIQEATKAGQLSPTIAFIGFLIGVCAIASGLTFLETIANPYTTVLGDPQYSATRINLAQSANGIGWVLGPIVGSIYFYSKDASGASTGSQSLYIPYVGIAAVVTVLAAIFYFAKVPDIKAKDDYHLDDAKPGVLRTIWSHPHFVLAVLAQFLYVAAQAGIFSFFINTMTPDKKTGVTIVPPIPVSWDDAMTKISNLVGTAGFFHDWLSGWFAPMKNGILCITDKGAANMQSLGFICFVLGRFSGTALMKKFEAFKILGVYGVLNVVACFLIFMNLGWLSVACVFLSFFFMSIMFPTIFALGIIGLGARAKKASAFIVMAIMGGALLP